MTEKTLIIYKNPPAFSGGFFCKLTVLTKFAVR